MKRQNEKRNIYLLSILPGVGYMYKGYMKRGISYMAFFLLTYKLGHWLSMGLLTLMSLLVWFYTFFDQVNHLATTEVQETSISDDIIFYSKIKNWNFKYLQEHPKVLGGVLFGYGGYLAIKNIYLSMIAWLPLSIRMILESLMSRTPQILLSCLVLYCGGCILKGDTRVIECVLNIIKPNRKNTERMNEFAASNVVYYLEKGNEKESCTKSMDVIARESMEKPKEFKQILEEKMREQQNIQLQNDTQLTTEEQMIEQQSREQLIRRARQLIDDEIYQTIHRKEEDTTQS